MDNSIERYGDWLFIERLPIAWGKECFTGADEPWQQIRVTFIQKSRYTGKLEVHKYMYSYPVTIYEEDE